MRFGLWRPPVQLLTGTGMVVQLSAIGKERGEDEQEGGEKRGGEEEREQGLHKGMWHSLKPGVDGYTWYLSTSKK